MEFLKEIIISTLYNNKIKVSIDFGDYNMDTILHMQSAKSLKQIHNILCDDTLDDFECIENIITIYQKLGISCANRHDF